MTTGRCVPLHSVAGGKVLLASLPEREVLRLVRRGIDRFTERTITSIEDLDRQLDSVARDGYVVSFEELEHGLNAVAAPIRDHTGMVVAALSVSGPGYRLTEERAVEIAPAVASAADAVGHRMGYQG